MSHVLHVEIHMDGQEIRCVALLFEYREGAKSGVERTGVRQVASDEKERDVIHCRRTAGERGHWGWAKTWALVWQGWAEMPTLSVIRIAGRDGQRHGHWSDRDGQRCPLYQLFESPAPGSPVREEHTLGLCVLCCVCGFY